jgi:hypothetical protein
VCIRALHWSLSRARSMQSIPSHSISLRSILILSTHLRLGLPSGLFPSGFPTKIPHNLLVFSHPRVSHAPPSSSASLDDSNYTRIWRTAQVIFLCSFILENMTVAPCDYLYPTCRLKVTGEWLVFSAVSSDFSQSLLAKARILLQNMTRPLDCTLIPTHHSKSSPNSTLKRIK